MAVLLVVRCERCGTEMRPDRARSEGSARARAAFHGWGRVEQRGVVLDVCPACVTAQLPVVQAAAVRALSGAAAGPAPRPRVVHPVAVVDADVAFCRWCEEGEHRFCTGCECSSGEHR